MKSLLVLQLHHLSVMSVTSVQAPASTVALFMLSRVINFGEWRGPICLIVSGSADPALGQAQSRRHKSAHTRGDEKKYNTK